MQMILTKFCKILLVFFLVLPQVADAQGFKSIIPEADSLFVQKSYSEAFALYDSALQSGVYTPQMLARMAYVQEGFGNLPQAMYYLSLLNRQSPNERTLRKLEELSEANNLQGYAISDQSYFFYLYRRYRLELMSILAIVGLLSVGALFWAFRRGYSPIGPGMVILTYSLFIAWMANFQQPTEQGIVTGKKVYVMDTPSAGGKLITSLEAGHRLPILSKRDIWYEIEWQGEKAFVRANNLKMVK